MQRRKRYRRRRRAVRGGRGIAQRSAIPLGLGVGMGGALRMLLPPALQFAQMLPGSAGLASTWPGFSSPAPSTSGPFDQFLQQMQENAGQYSPPTPTPAGDAADTVADPYPTPWSPPLPAEPIPSDPTLPGDLLLQSLLQNPLN